MNKLVISLVAVFFFSIGFLSSGLWENWLTICPKFWEIRAIELVQLILVFLLGSAFAYLISDRLNTSIKRKEILIEIFDRLQEKIVSLLNLGFAYMKEPSEQQEHKIVLGFKSVSIQLSLIRNLKLSKDNKKLKSFNESIFIDFIEFKAALTDTPFGKSKPEYSDDRQQKFLDLYEKLINQIYSFKIDLYN